MEKMQVQDLLEKADDLVDMATDQDRDLSKTENTKLRKMLGDARLLLKEINKKPATTSRKKAKAEPKKKKRQKGARMMKRPLCAPANR